MGRVARYKKTKSFDWSRTTSTSTSSEYIWGDHNQNPPTTKKRRTTKNVEPRKKWWKWKLEKNEIGRKLRSLIRGRPSPSSSSPSPSSSPPSPPPLPSPPSPPSRCPGKGRRGTRTRRKRNGSKFSTLWSLAPNFSVSTWFCCRCW